MTSLPAYPALQLPRRMSPDSEAVRAATLEYTYREFAPAVRGYFRSHRMDGADDLVGEVFVNVARNLCGFRGDADDLRRWVFAIARRRRVDQIRQRILRRLVVTSDPPERAVVDRSEGIDTDLVAALHELTALQREVVVLRFVADLPIDDVARIIRRSTAAVKALQIRALAQLARRLRHTEA